MSNDASTPAADAADEDPKRSPVEFMKESSRALRGTVALELVADSDHFNETDKNMIKFHGSYQQEDRDARKNRSKGATGKHYMFMIRCKIPGGRLTADQYLAMDRLAGEYANGTVRFTSRQSIQLHGILKKNLKSTIAGINHSLLTTLGGCGDVNRNVMACPAPHHHDGVHAQLQETAKLLAAHFAPRTTAYHEIWLNGEPVKPDTPTNDVEPLYGLVYLPRKFKMGIALPEDNCIDVYAQDLGLLAVQENGQVIGYNVLVGGGMGMTHGKAETFPRIGSPVCYAPLKAVVPICDAVVRVYRDHGNRADRKRARIKYLIHEWGVEKFRAAVADYLGGTPALPKPVEVTGYETHLGWTAQGDGKFFYGLSVENGRVKDEGEFKLRTAVRTIVEKLRPEVRLTGLQDVLFCDLPETAKAEIEQILADHNVPTADTLIASRIYSMACPAIPTCGLAISESERALPTLLQQLEGELRRLKLEHEPISVRMTGCPNGCVRPYQSDIGLVGRSGDKYTLFVGGHRFGTRLNAVLRDLVPAAEIVPVLKPVLEAFVAERRPADGKNGAETFGDFCRRVGNERLQSLLPAPAVKPRGHAASAAPAAS